MADRRIRAGAERLEAVLRIWLARHREAGQSDDEIEPRLTRILRPLAGSIPGPVRNAVAAEVARLVLGGFPLTGGAPEGTAEAAAPDPGGPGDLALVETPPPARLSPETRRAIEAVRLNLNWQELVAQSGGRLLRFVPGRRPGRRHRAGRRRAATPGTPLQLPNYLQVINPRTSGRAVTPVGARRGDDPAGS